MNQDKEEPGCFGIVFMVAALASFAIWLGMTIRKLDDRIDRVHEEIKVLHERIELPRAR